MSSESSADAADSQVCKRIKLEPCDISSSSSFYRTQYVNSRENQLSELRSSYQEHLMELFFLENSGNLMDYVAWSKRPNIHLSKLLQSASLDSTDDTKPEDQVWHCTVYMYLFLCGPPSGLQWDTKPEDQVWHCTVYMYLFLCGHPSGLQWDTKPEDQVWHCTVYMYLFLCGHPSGLQWDTKPEDQVWHCTVYMYLFLCCHPSGLQWDTKPEDQVWHCTVYMYLFLCGPPNALQWVTSLFDLTFAEPKFGLTTHFSQKVKWFRWAKVYAEKYGLSTYLDWRLVELWSK